MQKVMAEFATAGEESTEDSISSQMKQESDWNEVGATTNLNHFKGMRDNR